MKRESSDNIDNLNLTSEEDTFGSSKKGIRNPWHSYLLKAIMKAKN